MDLDDTQAPGGSALLPFVHQVLLPALPAPGTLTNASSDDQIIVLWLARPHISPRTRRNAGKDALRFQLWCRAYGLGLKDVRYEHLVAYTALLAKLPPEWINRIKLPRIDPAWRPFARQLTDRSQRQAVIVLKSMLTWMHHADYLPKNPAKLLDKLSLPLGQTVTRYLPPAGIDYQFRAAEELPAERPTQVFRRARAHFVVRANYSTAARLSELVGADMHNLRPDDHGEWWLHVIGKGSKTGAVPMSADLVEEYCRCRYLAAARSDSCPITPQPAPSSS
jgi:integrase/recombinase XerD